MMMPPPMPKRPERNPTEAPVRARNRKKGASTLFLHEDALHALCRGIEDFAYVGRRDPLFFKRGDKPVLAVLRHEDQKSARGLRIVQQDPFHGRDFGRP